VWSSIVVVGPPAAKRGAGLGEGREQRLVQELIPQPTIEALDECVLHRFAWRDVVPGNSALSAHASMALLVSSLPLSLTIIAGGPRQSITSSSSRPTRAPDNEVSAINAMHEVVHDSQDAKPRLSVSVADEVQ
jgi:hypothetical protein